jgi:hypothetical protein
VRAGKGAIAALPTEYSLISLDAALAVVP